MSINLNVGGKNIVENDERRLKVSSKGKRLFSFLLDFIFALLFVNTFAQVFRKEHWDLFIQSRGFQELIPFYGSVLLLLIFKDIFGNSPGKFLLGMEISAINHLSKQPSIFVLLSRNIFLLILPLEGIILLRDVYARRFADKLFATVVIDKNNPIRPILRIFLGNIIIFGFFSMAILFQRSSIEKSAAFQKAEEAIRNHDGLRKILDEYPVLEETEMHLDLSSSQEKNSIVRVRVGNEELGKAVKVYLKLQINSNSWEVVNVLVEPIEKSPN